MSLFSIKIIALLTMVVDHLGVFIFPNNIYLRLIGRLSFPLFAWAIANGAVHTRNIYRYLMRLSVLAVISQIPYVLIFRILGINEPGLNILFTFSLGLSAIILINKTKNTFFQILIIVLASLLALLLKTDYQIFGVLSVIAFFLFFNKPLIKGAAYFFLVSVFYIFPLYANRFAENVIKTSYLNIFELFSLLSIFIIAFYNNRKGKDLKLLFYIFYPAHLILLFLIKLFVP